MSIFDVIGNILKPVTSLIDEVVTTDEERGQIKNQLYAMQTEVNAKILEYEAKIVEMQSSVLQAEISAKSWMQRNWRPTLMFVIIAILFNNFILYPYMALFTDKVVMLDFPEELWTLMTVGVGGYIAGRSGEKILTNMMQKK